MEPAGHDHLKIYKEIAAEHNVDPNNEEAVLHFFRETAQHIPERDEIVERVLRANPTGIGVNPGDGYDSLFGDPNRIIEVPHGIAEIIESSEPNTITFNSPTWSKEPEVLPVDKVPDGMTNLKPGTWISFCSHRRAGTQALEEISSFHTIDPPIYSAEEINEFWNQASMRIDDQPDETE